MSFVRALVAGLALCLVAPNRAPAGDTIGDPTAAKGAQAAEHYNHGRFSEALKSYRDAQLEDPESPLLKFNIGDALYKTGDLDGAFAKFDELSNHADKALRAKSLYNKGNVYFEQQQFPQAVESFTESLAHDLQDEDARANLELALRYLQEQQQPQSGQKGEEGEGQKEGESQPGPDDEQGNEPPRQQPQESGDQGRESEEEEEEQKASQDDQHRDEDQSESADADSEGSDPTDSVDEAAEMARQEAEHLLDALRDRERKAQRLRYRARQSNQTRDW